MNDVSDRPRRDRAGNPWFWRATLRAVGTVALTVMLVAGVAPDTGSRAAAATNPTVSGTVVDSGGTPQPDVAITVSNAGSTSVVTTTTSDARGAFSVTIPSGTYDFRFTPPETSGLRTYVATGIDADHPAALTVVLKPVAVVTVSGVLRDSQGGVYPFGGVTFAAVGGLSTNVVTDSVGHYSVELLAGQYVVSAYFHRDFPAGGALYSGVSDLGAVVEFDQSQTFDVTIPTKALTISVRDVNGNPVTDAALRFDFTGVPGLGGYLYPAGNPRVDSQGNLTLSILAGATLINPAIVLNSGLTIPFTIPTLTTDRHLYLIFDRVTGGLFVDERAPIVTGAPDRAANAQGWYRAPVTITWSSTDPAPSSGVPTTPPPTVVSTEGADQVVTSQESCDPAGKCAAGHYTVSIDSTAPSIAATVTPTPNSNGWRNQPATVTFTCADALSGIASCPNPVTISADTPGQTVTGTATDNAGNTSSVSTTVKLDQTAPTITASLSQAPNANGWNNNDVVVTFACTDALSGVASCPQPVTLTDDGPNQVVTGTATDLAGNSATTQVTVSIDKTHPLITAIRTAANSDGWNNTGVTVTFTCSDAQSGIASCTPPVTLTQEGAGQTATGSAVNHAGLTAATTVTDINIDTTAPTITATVLGAPNSAGWYRTPPTIHYTCTDTLSGIATCPPDLPVTGDGANQSITATATDKAGNHAQATVTGLNIDRTAPAANVLGAVNGATYPLDQAPTVSCATIDATSGVATSAQLTISRDTTGVYTATCSGASDIAGNTTPPVAISYTITPTATSLSSLTTQYVAGSGAPSANGVTQDLQNKLLHGQICQYITKVNNETTPPHPTLTTTQAAELTYWARILDPTC